MRGVAERGRGLRFKDFLDGRRGFSFGEAGAVGDTENVRVDGESLGTERDVEDDIGGLAPATGQRFEQVTVGGDFAVMPVDEDA